MKKFLVFVTVVLLGFCLSVPVMAMQVHIDVLENGTVLLEVESSDTIEAVKLKIQEKTGIPAEQQILTFGSRQLEDGRTLADYNIGKGNTIYLVVDVTESESEPTTEPITAPDVDDVPEKCDCWCHQNSIFSIVMNFIYKIINAISGGAYYCCVH